MKTTGKMADLTVVYMADGTKSPVPVGYTVEEVVRALGETGHDPVYVREPDGTRTLLKGVAA